jgi:subtilisin family serine protease
MYRRLACALLLLPALAAAPALAAFPADPPDDPLYDASPLPNATSEQWDLASPALGFDRGISVDRAWPLTLGEGVTIADIDVGVEYDHPDLAGRWAPGGYDFHARDEDATADTGNSHGTNVAGVLGATADNGLGIAGIAPRSAILPVRTSDDVIHRGARVAEAVVHATDRGARSISMSLGADSFPGSLRRALDYAHRRGAVVSVASGNEFHFHHHLPQVHDDVLTVGGVNPDSANLSARDQSLARVASDFTIKASYSNYGAHLDVVAPTHVPTTDWGGGFRMTWDGTSATTPHVAGVAALVIARGRARGLELSAAEVMQIVRMSADDLADPAKGHAPGWDVLSGWGRVNAFAAVQRAEPGRVPPVADIDAPGWYEPTRGDVVVSGVARGRSAVSWQLEIGAGQQPAEWRAIGSGTGTAAAGARLGRVAAGELGAGTHTLRLRVTDADGNVGEDRALFHALRDPALRSGFPKRLGTSGEASPALADLDRDGAQDIVLATSDGELRVLSGRTGRSLRGWPRRMKASAGAGAAGRRIGTVRAGLVATPAIGDVIGGREPEVLAAGLDGRLYGWTARGRPLRGFPYRIGLRRPAEEGRLDAAIYASPALADLDGDRKLDAVFGAADQRVYAVKGNGRAVQGWPVLARDAADGAGGGGVAKIVSSPAIGDLDGDGRPDVVEGTGEAYGSTPSMTGRVYAWNARGERLPGWPVAPAALAANSIPLVGQGVPMSPVLADVDGDGRDEVAAAAFTGEPELYRGDGTRMGGAGGEGHFAFAGRGAGSPSASPGAIALGANAVFGRIRSDGPLRLFGGMVDSRLAAAQSSPATKVEFEHLIGGWDAASGAWLDAWPRPMEGWTIVAAPALADVDGDGAAEVLAGSSGNLLHAFREDGSEPGGWPKDTAGWLLAAPAVGDVDGDGRLEVVAVTRDGWLYTWDTPARASAAGAPWPSFRHDVRNTGRYGG